MLCHIVLYGSSSRPYRQAAVTTVPITRSLASGSVVYSSRRKLLNAE